MKQSDLPSRLLRALLASALLFVLTGLLLAPEGSRRGVQMDAHASSLPAPTEAASSAPRVTAPPGSAAFVGNRNSQVLHLPLCAALSRTAEENLVSFSTRQEALDAGYTPCQRCSP